MYLLYIIQSRCIKAVPDSNKNEFLVGVNTNSTCYVVSVDYDESSKKINSKDLITFETLYPDKMINSIIDLYPMNNVITTQVYNITDNVYQVKSFTVNGDNVEDIVKQDYDMCDSKNIFE